MSISAPLVERAADKQQYNYYSINIFESYISSGTVFSIQIQESSTTRERETLLKWHLDHVQVAIKTYKRSSIVQINGRKVHQLSVKAVYPEVVAVVLQQQQQ